MTSASSTFDVPLPPAFTAQAERLLGPGATVFLDALAQPPLSGLRVNTLKLTPEELQRLSPWRLEAVPWCEAGFFNPPQSPQRIWGEAEGGWGGKHPYHAAGLYYLQEPSAMAVGEILNPQPGERVLDLSAAPGGKATHLASLMKSQGWLLANEIHPRRAWELAENLERWGAQHVCVLNETPERLGSYFGAYFDRVLLDAPCSGEGMFRKSDAARREWSPEHVAGCAIRQDEILRQASRLVRPGGWLAYATCTFNPQENEAVIARVLEAGEKGELPHFELVEPSRRPGFDPGHPDWLPASITRLELTSMVRIWPHTAPGEGHTITLLRRSVDEPSERDLLPYRSTPLSKEAARAWREFCQSSLAPSTCELLDEAHIAQIGSYLYRLPPGMPDLGGLRAIHPGWWLGVLRKERLEPAHALALGLRGVDAQRKLDFEPDDPRLTAYLRGEALRGIPGEDGWLLVTVNTYPLGWGKRAQGVVKNFYPRGLRRF